jgi:type I restriction enzyme R subunit
MYAIKGDLDASGVYLGEEVETLLRCLLLAEAAAKRYGPSGDECSARPGRFALQPCGQRDDAGRGGDLARKSAGVPKPLRFPEPSHPIQDSDLERLYVFLRHLAAKLPRRKADPAYQFDDEVSSRILSLAEE